ncbi:MAG TPA: glycosyltransferase family 4 protein [Bryobacteraceae bacterium]|jgi:glycosyltransferase involved in cell wall biosynthesis|nr:glycosyltransferase family 4 protein [Bryobacteraceae bacterium]
MRILHLDGGKELRGGQWQVLHLIGGLYKAGVESTLLSRRESPLYRVARERGWRVEPLGIARAMALARSHDLVHAHDAHGHTVGAIASPGKLVVSRRVAFPIGSRLKYGCARHFLAVSEFVKGVLKEGGVPEEKITVVYDGVPLLDPSTGTQLMAPASDDPRKGSALARQAAERAGEHLRFSNDLIRDLNEAAIFLYITQSEGLGSGALLAMSAGVPVIASNVGGLPEVVEHTYTGLLVGNEDIYGSIRLLRIDHAYAWRLGAKGRQRVIDNFTVEHMVSRTMEVYRRVLS